MSTDFGAGEGGRGSQGDLNIYCRFPGSLDVPPEWRSLFLSLSSQVFFLLLRCLSLTPVPRWYFLVIASSASFFASWTPSFAVTFIASYTWNPAVPFILSLYFFFFFFTNLRNCWKKQTKKKLFIFARPTNEQPRPWLTHPWLWFWMPWWSSWGFQTAGILCVERTAEGHVLQVLFVK